MAKQPKIPSFLLAIFSIIILFGIIAKIVLNAILFIIPYLAIAGATIGTLYLIYILYIQYYFKSEKFKSIKKELIRYNSCELDKNFVSFLLSFFF